MDIAIFTGFQLQPFSGFRMLTQRHFDFEVAMAHHPGKQFDTFCSRFRPMLLV